jgi:hypothetical protein
MAKYECKHTRFFRKSVVCPILTKLPSGQQIFVKVLNIICHKKSFQWQDRCSTLTNKRQDGHEAAKSCCSQYFANATKNSKKLNKKMQ